jgi:hypothetical protein
MRPSSRVGAFAALCLVSIAVGIVPGTRARAAGTPTFVQQVTAHGAGTVTRAVTTPAVTTAGNRLIVEVGVWNWQNATITSVTDNAGDTFVKVLSFTASDHAQMTVWTAPVTTGGTRPTITARATSSADIGIVALEYAGLSTVADATAVDVEAHNSGSTSGAATVSSGATPAVTADGELAIGFYADSGFGDTLSAGSGWTQRSNISGVGDMDMYAEDRLVDTGATPAATVNSSSSTTWLLATLVFRVGAPPAPTVPGAPTNVTATPADASATVTWTAPGTGGSPITSYTVTPYIGTTAQPTTTVTGTTASITGLTNGTAYTFTVTATNAVGSGPASAPSAAVTPGAQAGGQWSSLSTLPIVAISNSLLYNGNVVAWDGWQQPQPSVVWNPSSPSTFTTVNAPDSVFCDGGAALPDGRLLVVGGYGGLSTGQLGIVDTTIFDPATNSWSRVADMHLPRWYPTVTELADGRYLAISGNSSDSTHWADTPEVYDPKTNTWTLLSGISTPQVHEDEYPFSYLLPSGKVFTIGPDEDNSFLLDANARTWTPVGGASGVHNGSSVMYRPGKVLYSGGGVNINAAGPSFRTTAVIDLTAPTPTWQQTASMNSARVYHTLTMLADGTVLAVGGAPDTDQHIVTTGVLPTEIWNPATMTWTPGAPMAASRNYHSTALLLPDGRVYVAGGGHPFGQSDAGQYSAQTYSPSYLFNGARPTITSVPSTASYGSSISVQTPDAGSITAVNLVSLGADTHQMDMNQRFVPLNFTANGSSLSIQAPSAAELAPPGYYMLFILNDKGVPAVAPIIKLTRPAAAPGAPSNVTAIPGDASATVSWSAPNDGGSPITGYTVTPYIGSTQQASTVVTGTSATINGLTNGTAYTFTVTATNAIGTSPPSAPSVPVTPTAVTAPTFVQQNAAQAAGVTSESVTLPAGLVGGHRLVVEVGVWNQAHSVATGVTDSAGDVFTRVSQRTASDGTELGVWTAPVTGGAGRTPSITATVSGAADVGVLAMEYAGLSTDANPVDQQASASGTTSGAATVSSGATAATSGSGLAIGFYLDSGFGRTLAAGSGWTVRGNLSPNGNMDLFTEDKAVAAGATPNASVAVGGSAIWQLATVVFKPAAPAGPSTAPGAPTGVTAVAGNASAAVSWSPPGNDGGSPVTAYTVTPYIGTSAQPSTVVAGTSTTVTGLTNGTAYTFAVSASNAVGTGPPSVPSSPVTPSAAPTPAFVQQVSAQGANRTSLAVTTTADTTAGDRLIVEVGVWSGSNATVSTVTDNAGDTFTKLTSSTASDHAQISVWTAVVATGGTKPVITATASGSADIGVVALEYSGLSTAATVVDQSHTATGTTAGAGSVSSGATPAVTADGELAIGFYADSGFGALLSGGAGLTTRANVSPNGNMDMLVQDTLVNTGATPASTVTTGPSTVWLAAVVVFKHG